VGDITIFEDAAACPLVAMLSAMRTPGNTEMCRHGGTTYAKELLAELVQEALDLGVSVL